MMKSVVFIAFAVQLCCVSSGSNSAGSFPQTAENLYRNPLRSVLFNSFTPTMFPERVEFVVNYSRPYLSNEVDEVHLMASWRISRDVFGLNFSYDGFSLYYESLFGITYTRELMDKFILGVRFDHIRIKIKDLSKKNIYTGELALQYRLQERLTWAFRVFNPFQWKLSEDGVDTYPVYFASGVEYAVNSKVKLISEIKKKIRSPIHLNLGLFYQPIEKMGFHLGSMINPVSYYGGFAIGFKNFVLQTDIVSGSIPAITPTIQLHYLIK